MKFQLIKILLSLILTFAFESSFAQNSNFGHPQHIVLGQEFVDAIRKNDLEKIQNLSLENCNFQIVIINGNGEVSTSNYKQKEFFLFLRKELSNKYSENQNVFVQNTQDNIYTMKIPYLEYNKTDTLYCGNRIITMIRPNYDWKVLNFIETRELANCKYIWRENK